MDERQVYHDPFLFFEPMALVVSAEWFDAIRQVKWVAISQVSRHFKRHMRKTNARH